MNGGVELSNRLKTTTVELTGLNSANKRPPLRYGNLRCWTSAILGVPYQYDVPFACDLDTAAGLAERALLPDEVGWALHLNHRSSPESTDELFDIQMPDYVRDVVI